MKMNQHNNQRNAKSAHRSAKVIFTILALPLTLSACTNFLRQPDPAAASNLTTAAYPTLLNQTLSSQADTSIAAKGWSDYFSDPKLKQLIQLGLDNNRDMRTATLNIELARAQYQLANSPQLPTVGINAGTNTAGNKSNNSTTYTAGLGLTSYELDFWGRVANLKDQALQSFFSTESARATTQISIVSQIAQSYLALAFDQEQLKLAQQTLVAQQKSYELNQAQFNAGIISLVPVKQAQISVETANLAIGNAQTLVAQDRNLLALTIGLPAVPDALIPQGAVEQITTSPLLPAGLPSELLRRRPDIAQAEYALKASGANIAVARAAYFPKISLTGDVGYSSPSLSNLFKSGSFAWNVGPSITLPIFDNGSRKATLETARVQQQIQLTAYEKSIQSAFREVADVLAVRATIDDRLASQDRLVNASTANYNLSNASFKAGVTDYLTVLVAQTSLFNAQQAQITLKRAALLSQVNLYTALGGGAVNQIGLDVAPVGDAGNTTAQAVK
jgi:multidrug efflux system outer membrane protein